MMKASYVEKITVRAPGILRELFIQTSGQKEVKEPVPEQSRARRESPSPNPPFGPVTARVTAAPHVAQPMPGDVFKMVPVTVQLEVWG